MRLSYTFSLLRLKSRPSCCVLMPAKTRSGAYPCLPSRTFTGRTTRLSVNHTGRQTFATFKVAQGVPHS
jgi:hypothetical protein